MEVYRELSQTEQQPVDILARSAEGQGQFHASIFTVGAIPNISIPVTLCLCQSKKIDFHSLIVKSKLSPASGTDNKLLIYT